MKARFGGLLAIALGTVLIVNGVSSASSGTVGVGTPPPDGTCGSQRALGAGIIPVGNCPTGSIVITETTTGSATAPAAGWEVTVTSTCLDTSGNGPVDRTVTVADGQSVTLGGLYIFPSDGADVNSPKCQYVLAETPVAGVTATFDPESPVEIGYDDNDQNKRTVAVALTNTAALPSSDPVTPSDSASASVTLEPSESGPSTDFTDTDAGSASASAGAGDEGAGGGSQSAAPIAETGPSQPITASLWLGIGLVFLGLFLLFEGRIRRLGKHRT